MYHAVNLVIFVLWWLSLIGMNVYISYCIITPHYTFGQWKIPVLWQCNYDLSHWYWFRICRRHNILLTPHKRDSAQCGVMTMNASSACGRHATMTLIVAYLWHAVFYHERRHPKLRPAALLGVNRITCFQHATINKDYTLASDPLPLRILTASSAFEKTVREI